MSKIVRGDFHINIIRKNQLKKQYSKVHASNEFEKVVEEVTQVCETTVLFGSSYLQTHPFSQRRSFRRPMFFQPFPGFFEKRMRVSHQANINLRRDVSIIKISEGRRFSNQV